MATIHPIRIPGRWREGYALDFHTTGSVYIGDDEYGHPQFDTKRTEIGDLLYRLKYRSDRTAIPEIVETAAAFVRGWQPDLSLLIAVPPSKQRAVQPLLLVAEPLAGELGLGFRADRVRKRRDVPELKDVYDFHKRVELLTGAYEVGDGVFTGKRLLLFDDLYRSGATLNAVTSLLYDEGKASEVFALTITRTRTNQ